jgi:hypothetical protein
MDWFKRARDKLRAPAPLPDPPPVDPGVFATLARAPTFNPNDEQQVVFAEYRADAIAREIEQRREDGREAHPEHDQIVAEAMSYAWMLVKAGKWTTEHVSALALRLR